MRVCRRATMTRLIKNWQEETTAFNRRSLAQADYVYVWVDGIHLRSAWSRTRYVCWS